MVGGRPLLHVSIVSADVILIHVPTIIKAMQIDIYLLY